MPLPSCLLVAHKPLYVRSIQRDGAAAHLVINAQSVAPYWGAPTTHDGRWTLAVGDAIIVTWMHNGHQQVSIVHADTSEVTYWAVLARFHQEVIEKWSHNASDHDITDAVVLAQERGNTSLQAFLAAILALRTEITEEVGRPEAAR